MPTSDSQRHLPSNPNLAQLNNQAEELKRAVVALDKRALDRVHSFHPSYSPDAEPDPDSFTLRDARLTIAREYGFDGWHGLSTHVGKQMVEEHDLHRWFGVQLNNQVWESIADDGVGSHTPLLEKERMIYSAYASAYHWRNAGNEANFARGEHLISRMAARLGESDLALRHARRCLELVEAHPDVMEDWDLPFAHEALARALAAAGDHGVARTHFDRASVLTQALKDDADRGIIESELAREPWFGLI